MQFSKLTLLAILGVAFAAPIEATALAKQSNYKSSSSRSGYTRSQSQKISHDKSKLRSNTHSYNKEKGKLRNDQRKLNKDFRQGRGQHTIDRQEQRVDRDLNALNVTRTGSIVK